MRRVGLALLVMVATSVIAVLPVSAEHDCTWQRIVDPETGEAALELVCPPHEDTPGDGGGGGEPKDCGPWFPASPPSEDEDGSVWQEQFRYCLVDEETITETRSVCVASCPSDPDPVDIFEGLLERAIGQVNAPLPGMRTSFDQPAHDGQVRAVVNAESWWWAASTDPIEEYDEDGSVWVRVTATAERMEVDPGDGSDLIVALHADEPHYAEQADCPLPGAVYNRNQSYYDQTPGKKRGACVHVYEEVADEVTATMTVTWSVTYQGFIPGVGGVSGTVGEQVREQTLTFPVSEIQSVIVR